jgi:D-alanine-D-alanine ligase
MKIAVIYNTVDADEGPDAMDVLTQVEAVAAALASLGHEVSRLGCSLDLERMRHQLITLKPDLVFNLVESLEGYGSLIHLLPWLLEALQLPYSGSGAEAIQLTSNKTAAKKRLQHFGLPTPSWFGPFPEITRGLARQDGFTRDKTWIIKSVWEHASIGLDADSLLQTDSAAALEAEMKQRVSSLGGACFAEEFIEGREFNLSLLAGDREPVLLPPAEICFTGYAEDKPHIVDYRAKWAEDSFEYQNTPRSFDFAAEDAFLLAELKKLARRCWDVFNLRGYARVDFRVDSRQQPWILEINANPCLSPDAGFAAALTRSGLGFKQAVQAIIADAPRVG